jgi:putative photosynthetic complex assembly protein
MSTHSHADMLPRGTLITAGALVLFALTATATVRLAHIPPAASPAAMRQAEHLVPVEQRNLRFIDRADGAVVIQDADRGDNASVIEPGQKTGFIRGVMRGLARERRARGIGDQPPFNLALYRDGELSLTDSATGRSIEMTAFGSTNRASFMALLPAQGPIS